MGRRGAIDRIFLWLTIGLTIFGIVILISASGPLGYQQFGDSLYFLKHQLLRGVIPGVILFFVISRIDYHFFQKLAFPVFLLSLVLLIFVYIPGIGVQLGGSARWIQFGPVSVQPSEFVKVTFVLYVAAWLAARHGSRSSETESSLPFFAALGVVMLLLIKQPNTGSMMVIVGSALATYFVSGAPLVLFFGMGGAGLALLAILIKLTPYRTARFMTFLHPELDPQGIGYHINQAFLAVGSGGLFGLGYGHSRQKYLYLPEVAGDSIFAVMAEELGFFMMLCFLAALAFFVWRCLKISAHAPDPFGRYLVVGIASWIAIQSFLNMSSMIGLLPMTGVTLPFVSYGSSAFLAMSVGCGLIASVSRTGKA